LIVLDTNVVSELMMPKPDESVLRWIEEQDPDQVFLTAISVAEIAYGIARLRAGPRKRQLAQLAGSLFADFIDLTLPFDSESAGIYGPLVVKRERAGRPISTEDAQIAAICSLHNAALATRNTKDFD
jgi:predicted nucleic acid-binding protein